MSHLIRSRMLRWGATFGFLLAIVTSAWSQSISFTPGELSGYTGKNPTSLQFGPDGRLYVATQGGDIEALSIGRTGPGSYHVTGIETIDLVRLIPNHNDDGTPHVGQASRQVTGILVAGTLQQPVLYVTSSDYRIGGAGGATDTNLDTNSGILSRLTQEGSGQWAKVDLVRGLPRSEENHSPNGLQFDAEANIIYIAQGGNTNAGAPSNNFAFLGETALAAAILSVELDAIEAMPIQGTDTANPWIYDLPTVDDPTRANLPDGSDPGDPFGGNDGLNQARIVPGGPVQVYAPGFRNPYDLLITESGRMYTVDNGANFGWGGTPILTDPSDPSTATNDYDSSEPGGDTGSPDANGNEVTNMDSLHFITGPGYYGGHPNPIRANPEGAGWYTYRNDEGVWRTSTSGPNPLPADWPPVPVEMANPIEGAFESGDNPKALYEWPHSTNGLTEYTASNFGGAMIGNLLTVTFGGRLDRIVLNGAGDSVQTVSNAASNFGMIPLDVIAQGDNDLFPGTIWVAVYGSNTIVAFEPTDYDGSVGDDCLGIDSPNLDEDGDGYSNADEIANGSDPCNPASTPPDFDGDFVSDLWDDDDDGDGIPDLVDPFQRDPYNGALDYLPHTLELLNGEPGYGYAGVGFTGWMIDYETDYLEMYDEESIIAGGASGIFTITGVGHGDARLGKNDQRNAFQFGLNIDAQTGPFYIVTRVMANNLFGTQPQGYQSVGLYIGNGDQDNYLRVSAAANGGVGGIEVFYESGGAEAAHQMHPAPGVLSATEYIDLYLSINPASGEVLPSYRIDNGSVQELAPVTVDDPILTLLRKAPDSSGSHALAVGIIATSNPRELGTPLEDTLFTASWDFIYAMNHDDPLTHEWDVMETTNSCEARHESGLAAVNGQIVLMGGRGLKPVEQLDFGNATWHAGAHPPIELHHFQPVAYEGLIYVVGALTGSYPTEEPVDRIYIYDPVADTWYDGPEIPEDRRRGSAGVALLNGKIYIAGGTTLGHGQGAEHTVAWMDVYDPLNNTWTVLPNAPHARDHTQLVDAGGKLYLVGGRIGGLEGGNPPNFFGATVPEVDVFDPIAESWTTLEDDLPTPRGGVMAARLGPRVVVAGGETTQATAHDEVEAYNIDSQEWETLGSLNEGRHGTGMVSVGDALYIVAGSGNQGGSPELDSVEVFTADEPINPMEAVIPGTLSIEPSSLAFGPRMAGESITETVVISNTEGNQGIVIEDIGFGGSGEFALSHSHDLPLILAPGHELEIGVTFNPSSAGIQSGTLTVTHNGVASSVISVEGTVVPPTGGGSPIRINSGGSQFIDSAGRTWMDDSYYSGGSTYSAASSLTIAGTDDSVLYRSERSGESFSYAIPVAPGSYDVRLHNAEIWFGVGIGVGSDHTGARVFSVTLEGEEVVSDYDLWADVGSATAVIHSFANVSVTDGVLNITVEGSVENGKLAAIEVIPVGEAPEGSLQADAKSLFFGNAPNSRALSVTLTNTGDAALTISGQSIVGSGAARFSAESLAGTSLAPDESVAIDVTFTRQSFDGTRANLVIEHNGEEGPLAIELIGPKVALSSTPGHTDFGQVALGESSSRTLTVTNSGEETITLTGSISGDNDTAFAFNITGQGVLEAGDSVSVEVTFTPEFDDFEHYGTLVFGSFGDTSILSHTLFGRGQADTPGLPGGTLASNPASVSFGTLTVGSSSASTITLTNSGQAAVTLNSVNLTGANAAQFGHNLSGNPQLAPGNSVTVEVRFMPTSAGAASASLVIAHSGDNSPLSISLSGTGGAASGPFLEAFPTATLDEETGLWTSPWFGTFRAEEDELPWIWHTDHGWLYLHPVETDAAFWFYDMHHGWAYVSNTAYPWIYYTAADEWCYYSGEGMENGRWFWSHGRSWFLASEF